MPMNFARTGLLLAVLTGILVAMGGVVAGRGGMLIALVIAAGINLFSYWRSDTLVLGMYGAEEVDARSGGEYYKIVADLVARAGLPMPRVYVMHNPQPNAFATGRNPEHAAVCASTGLLEMLNAQEVSGVLAHELAHIKNRDTLTMAIAATIGGAISMLAQYLQFGALFGGHRDNNSLGWIGALVAMIVAPFAAMLVQMAVSRSGWPPRSARSRAMPTRSATSRRRQPRQRRTCSSSIPSPGRAWTISSPPIPTRKIASLSSKNLPRRWGCPARPREVRRDHRRDLGAEDPRLVRAGPGAEAHRFCCGVRSVRRREDHQPMAGVLRAGKVRHAEQLKPRRSMRVAHHPRAHHRRVHHRRVHHPRAQRMRAQAMHGHRRAWLRSLAQLAFPTTGQRFNPADRPWLANLAG